MKSGSSGKTTTTNVNYSPEEAARRTAVMDEAGAVYGDTKNLVANSPYPGAQVAAPSAATVGAQQNALTNAATYKPIFDELARSVGYGLTGAMDVENNPYLASAVEGAIRPITESYTDAGGVMSQIRSGANLAEQYGGSRQGIAEGIAGGRYADAVKDVTGQMYSDAYNKGQDTFARIFGLAPQALNSLNTPAEWMSAVGAQQDTTAQQNLDYQALAREWELNAPWMPIQNYANIVYGAGSGGGTSTSSTSAGKTNPVLGAAGGALSGYALGSQIGMIGGPAGAVGGAILGALMS